MCSDKIVNMCFIGCLLIAWSFPKMDTKRGEQLKLFITMCNMTLAVVMLGYNMMRVL